MEGVPEVTLPKRTGHAYLVTQFDTRNQYSTSESVILV